MKAFRNLEPSPRDDVHLSLDLGKLVGLKEHGDRESRLRYFLTRVVHSDSDRAAKGASQLPHLAPLAVDGDPATWWPVAPRSCTTCRCPAGSSTM